MTLPKMIMKPISLVVVAAALALSGCADGGPSAAVLAQLQAGLDRAQADQDTAQTALNVTQEALTQGTAEGNVEQAQMLVAQAQAVIEDAEAAQAAAQAVLEEAQAAGAESAAEQAQTLLDQAQAILAKARSALTAARAVLGAAEEAARRAAEAEAARRAAAAAAGAAQRRRAEACRQGRIYCAGSAKSIASELVGRVATKAKSGPRILATNADPSETGTTFAASVLTSKPHRGFVDIAVEVDRLFDSETGLYTGPVHYIINYREDERDSQGDRTTDENGQYTIDDTNSIFLITDTEITTDPAKALFDRPSVARSTVGGGLHRAILSATRADKSTVEIVIFTDANHTGVTQDTDYVALGAWMISPAAATDAQIGAFSYGTHEYKRAGLATISSGQTTEATAKSASYSGFVGGKRIANGSVRDFTSNVSLTAKFFDTTANNPSDKENTYDAFGTIEGSVDMGSGEKLILKKTSLLDRDLEGGPYFGDTQMVRNGNDVAGFVGKWGGQFFGPQDTTNGPPKTAGTLGAANGDNTESIMGTFLANRSGN